MADFKECWHKIGNFLLYTFVCILLTIAVGFCAVFIVPLAVLPMIAKHKAKDPNNVKTGGCLMYKGQMTGRTNARLYSLNGQNKKAIDAITIKNSPFDTKWQHYNNDRFDSKGLCKPIDRFQFKHPHDFADYDGWFHIKFHKKHKNECFAVDYVSVKLWWIEADYAYDVDKNFVCLE